MSAKQKLHQANLDRWVLIIQAQVDSGLKIKAWCEQNNVSFNTYNYWKHQLKEEYVDTCLPDIVQVSPTLQFQQKMLLHHKLNSHLNHTIHTNCTIRVKILAYLVQASCNIRTLVPE